MKLKFSLNKKNIIIYVLVSLLAAILCLWSKSPIWYFLGFAVLYAALRFSEVEMKDYVPGWIKKGNVQDAKDDAQKTKKGLFGSKKPITYNWMLGLAVSAALVYGGAWFSTWCMQRIILEDNLIAKSSKSVYANNMWFVLILYLAMLALLARVSWALIASHLLMLVIGFADYFVYEFRENEISIGDISTVGTGLSVVTRYKFVMPVRGAAILLLTILLIALVRKFCFRFRHPILVRLVFIAAVVYLAPYSWGRVSKKVTQTWEKKGTYKNGFIVNFMCGIRDSKVTRPGGYNLEEIGALEKIYGGGLSAADLTGNSADDAETSTDTADTSADTAAGDTVKPTIITIMSESFADYRLLGDLVTNMEVTPFIDSLQENTTRGYALSSVYGAKTPNSEWEYLTGNSMAFLPGGSVPYQQYIDKKPTSMVSTLKNEGYTAVAMHPYYSTGWRRSTVYPWMGFDELKFMDTGDFDEENLMRQYITDKELYDRIIQRYEAKAEDENLFIMSISMQNHGGYKDVYDNFKQDILPAGDFFDASQYLSLLHQTDIATEELIHYFENVDEPVEIVFFGDHYPSLSGSFVKSINNKGTTGLTLSELEGLFSVPFFIWTNYDTPEVTIERSSLNYLSTLALDIAGIELPPYNRFLKDMMEVVPAINVRGYYSETEGRYLHVTDAVGEEKTWIGRYRHLQYNAMFDKENRSDVFFPYITSTSLTG